MKRTALLYFPLLGATSLQGQTVNFRAGVSRAQFVTEAIRNVNTSTGFTGGISLDIPAEGMPFRIGASWVRKDTSAEYVEIPVLLLIASDLGSVSASVFTAVGVPVGIRTGGITPCSRTDEPYNTSRMARSTALAWSGSVGGFSDPCPPLGLYPLGKPVERFDFSGAIGAGFTVPPTASLSYGMAVVYLHGFAELDGPETKSRTFLATTGIGIPLGSGSVLTARLDGPSPAPFLHWTKRSKSAGHLPSGHAHLLDDSRAT